MFLTVLLSMESILINFGKNKGWENKRVEIRMQDSVKSKSVIKC